MARHDAIPFCLFELSPSLPRHKDLAIFLLLEAGNQRWTYDIHCCSDPKRTNKYRWKRNLWAMNKLGILFNCLPFFVPFHYGEIEGGQKAILKLLKFIDFQWKTLRSVALIYNVRCFGPVLKKRPNKCVYIIRRRYHFLREIIVLYAI